MIKIFVTYYTNHRYTRVYNTGACKVIKTSLQFYEKIQRKKVCNQMIIIVCDICIQLNNKIQKRDIIFHAFFIKNEYKYNKG